MDILDNAIIFAVKAHSGAKRKDGSPYIVHPMEAAAIAATMTGDREVIAAAVLHDTLEDTSATREEIREQFGDRVLALIAADTENKRPSVSAEDSWRIRKQETLDFLKTAKRESKIIVLSDKLSNMRSLYRDYLCVGERVWERFHQKDKKMHRWYYEGIAANLQEFKEEAAYKEYCALIKKVFD